MIRYQKETLIVFILALIFSGCSKVNLVSMPLKPPPSAIQSKSDYTLILDSLEIRGVPNKNRIRNVEDNFLSYIDHARYFKQVYNMSDNGKPDTENTISAKAVLKPVADDRYNWWVTWPAVYPMPFYWPFQPKKGKIAIEMTCELYDRAGEKITTLHASDSDTFSVTYYGFFHNGDAELKMKKSYKKIFQEITDKIVSNEKILALTHRKKSSTALATHSMPVKPQIKPYAGISPAKQSLAAFGRYHALVIGINKYKQLPRLRTAENDARALADLLRKKYGYRVDLLLNPTRSQIIAALGKYRRTMTKNDNLLIYYAGHGWLDNQADEGYWLPVDASQADETNWISNSTITAAIRANGAKHILVVADSCYSGKLTRAIHINRKIPGYFKQLSQKKTRVALASGGLEPVEDGSGKQRHSVFASAFIDALKETTQITDGTHIFMKIRRPVLLNADQTPEYGDIRKAGHNGGDFIFVPLNQTIR